MSSVEPTPFEVHQISQNLPSLRTGLEKIAALDLLSVVLLYSVGAASTVELSPFALENPADVVLGGDL